MRFVLPLAALLLLSAPAAEAGVHDIYTKVSRHFGIHRGAGYHAPKPDVGQPTWDPAAWGESNRIVEPVLPAPHVRSPYHPAANTRQLPPPQPQLKLQREAQHGWHFFPMQK